jgi:hypothetical protein
MPWRLVEAGANGLARLLDPWSTISRLGAMGQDRQSNPVRHR